MNAKNIVLSLTAMFFLVGCVEPIAKKQEVTTGYVGKNTEIEMNSVRVLDKDLIDVEKKQFLGKIGPVKKKPKTRIVIESHGLTSTETGFSEVVVSIRNQTDYPLRVQGSVSWFDENELPLSRNNTGWQTIFLEPKTMRVFRENATSDRASYYVVDIKE